MKIKSTPSFKRELKQLAKKHYPINLLNDCLKAIANNDKPTLQKIKDHALTGKWKGYREFHPSRISSNKNQYDGWIVIYKFEENQLILVLVATGNHSILNK